MMDKSDLLFYGGKMKLISNLFGSNKEKLLEKRCKEILEFNLILATNWQQTMAVRLSLDEATFLVEMDIYLYCLSDYFLKKNCVDNNIRQTLLTHVTQRSNLVRIWLYIWPKFTLF
jgi:hypothetical protein